MRCRAFDSPNSITTARPDADNFYYNICGWAERLSISASMKRPRDSRRPGAHRLLQDGRHALKNLSAIAHIIDLGAAYGGSHAILRESEYGWFGLCLKISEAQKRHQPLPQSPPRRSRADQGWRTGSFDKIPATQRDLSRSSVTGFDPACERIAKTGSFARGGIACLKPGVCEMIITDSMPGGRPCPRRAAGRSMTAIHSSESLGSPGYYREIAEKLRLRNLGSNSADLTPEPAPRIIPVWARTSFYAGQFTTMSSSRLPPRPSSTGCLAGLDNLG